MTQICGICKNVPTMPFTTVCNDIFCHLCIKTYILNNNQPNCPSCHESIKNDCDKINEMKHSYTTTDVNHIFLNQNYLWLYATNYGNNWWVYDIKSNNKLERIHNDYLTRLDMKNNKNVATNPIQLNLSIKNIKKSQVNKIVSNDFVSITVDTNDLNDADVDFNNSQVNHHKETQIEDIATGEVQSDDGGRT